MALIAADKNKLQEKADEGNNRAKLILKIREDQSRFLSTIQVGITFAGFFSSAFAATGISTRLASFFESQGILYSDRLAIIIITILLSFYFSFWRTCS